MAYQKKEMNGKCPECGFNYRYGVCINCKWTAPDISKQEISNTVRKAW